MTDTATNLLPKKRRPVCGICSVAFPLIGIALAYGVQLATSSYESGGGMVTGFFMIMILAASFFLGLISAIVGLVRWERPIWFSLIGLCLNGSPLIWMFF